MRLSLVLVPLLLATNVHAADVMKDAGALRQKVQKGYSKAALRKLDRAVRTGRPKGTPEEADLSGNGFQRHMIKDREGRSLTSDRHAQMGYEALYATRYRASADLLRNKGVQLSKKDGLTITDTVTKMERDGSSRTEGELHRERRLLGGLLRVESTTRYRATIGEGGTKLVAKEILADKRRVSLLGIKMWLPAKGKQAIDKMYAPMK